MEILHQDRQIIVVQKPAGLLTVATEDGENEITLQSELYHRLRKEGGKNPPLFIVQRLDLKPVVFSLLPALPKLETTSSVSC